MICSLMDASFLPSFFFGIYLNIKLFCDPRMFFVVIFFFLLSFFFCVLVVLSQATALATLSEESRGGQLSNTSKKRWIHLIGQGWG
jgi:hypothetical protein